MGQQRSSEQLSASPAGGSGYATVEDDGTPLTQRTTINFVGAGVSVTDSGGKTVATIAGGGGTSGQATVDFSTGLEQATVTVSEAAVDTLSRITATMAYDPTGTRDRDELEMDSFEVKCGNIVDGVSFDILATCLTGNGHGTYYVNWGF